MKLNDKEIKLVYDMTAVRKFEREFDMTINNALTKEKLGIGVVGGLVWAGMLHQNPVLPIEQAEKEIFDSIKKGENDYKNLIEEAIEEIKESGVLGGLSKN